jgi:hypothetical protein
MSGRDRTSKVEDLLAFERWANEGGRVAADSVLEREEAEVQRVLASFSQPYCVKDAEGARA